MGGACNTYGGKGEEHAGFWWENLRETGYLEDPGADGEYNINTLRTGSFKLFKRPLPGFLIILTL